MAASGAARQRLAQQRLTGELLDSAAAVVSWLGAVQSQEYLEARWSLGLRFRDSREEAVEQALNAGEILRTHVLRPTWHFVAPADIRWLLDLTAGRVLAGLKSRYRQLDLDAGQFARANDAIARALEGGRSLTRPELGAALKAAGISTEGQRLPHMLMHAEMDAVIVSGPRRGKEITYALFDERVPPAPRPAREEALAELVRRYFAGHGPATVRDFTWWSGLTTADAKAGLQAAGQALAQVQVDGEAMYAAAELLPAPDLSQTAFLLPTFDEFLVGYSGFEQSRWPAPADPKGHFQPRAVAGGRVVASWRRAIQKDTLQITIAPFFSLVNAEVDALQAAAERYGQFVGLPVQVEIRQLAAAS